MTSRQRRSESNGASRAAFTLVEMIITIGVIVLLTALTVSATVALSRKSEVRQTENMLRLLDMAVQEWEIKADRKITWGDGATYEMQDDTPHVFTATEVLRRIRSSDVVRSFLAQIRPEFLYEYDYENTGEIPPWLPTTPDQDDPDPHADMARMQLLSYAWDGELAVLDPWGVPIRAVHPGPVFEPGDPGEPDPDGTIYLGDQTYGVELFYGRARSRRIRFVSAGPDGKFGNLSLDHDAPIHEQAHDNIYSYSVEDTHE